MSATNFDSVEQVPDALEYVKSVGRTAEYDESRYHAALTLIVDNPNLVPHRIYFDLPGGLSGNSDEKWQHIKDNSVERCSCGNERMLQPGNPRTEFQESPEGSIVLSGDVQVYLRPIGADKPATDIKLWCLDQGVAHLFDPFAPFVFSFDILSTPYLPWEKLAELLETSQENGSPAVLSKGSKQGSPIPLFRIDAVDVENKSVTITPDAALENFSPDDEKDKEHDCSSDGD